ncbi:MAG: helix-turn-helix domain-containing protein [Clostridiales bacterium]|nr:helix-turn-helix domain-containing protein [Clostridiales bacterium]
MLSDKLKQLRKQKKITQEKLANMLNVETSSISKYESANVMPSIDTLAEIANIFDVSIDYLLGRVDKNITPVSLERDTIKIPVLGRIPAGMPLEAIEDISDYIEIPRNWTAGDKEFFALEIKGDSMYPEYLSGDTVIFERCSTCETGDDCVVAINGDDATFKRVERKENGIMVKPLNPEYETMFFTNEEVENKPVEIRGIARELRRRK